MARNSSGLPGEKAPGRFFEMLEWTSRRTELARKSNAWRPEFAAKRDGRVLVFSVVGFMLYDLQLEVKSRSEGVPRLKRLCQVRKAGRERKERYSLSPLDQLYKSRF